MAANQTNGAAAPSPEIELQRRIAALRSQVRDSFGKVVMAMMMTARYRHQTLADLQHLVLDPLVRDRIAIAYAGDAGPTDDLAGIAIWASVSEAVDAEIRAQIRAGVFPVRLKPEDWQSGETHWLLDVLAADSKATATVLANFRQVAKSGPLHLHPMVAKLVDEKTLAKLGAEKLPPKADS